MRRYFTAGLISALALAAGTAQAQIAVTQPVIGDAEFAGTPTIVTFDIDAGLNGGGIVLDSEVIEVAFDLIDDDGNVLLGPFNVDTVGGPVNYVDAVGNADVQVDLGDVNFESGLNNPAVTGIRLKIRTSGGAAMMFEEAPLDNGDEANDEVLEVVRGNEAPVLQSAFVTDDDMFVFFEFDKALSNGDAANDDNQTLLADIDGNDFNENTSNDFSTPAAAVALSNAAFVSVGGEDRFLRLERGGGATLGAGDFVRPAADAMGDPMNDIFDIVGLSAASDAVQVQAQEALTITEVVVLTAMDAGDFAPRGSDFNNSIEVFFNLPLSGDIGDTAFYGGYLKLPDGTDSDFLIDGVSPGSQSNSVFLDIDVDGNNGFVDQIRANGTNEDGESYSIITDENEDVPSSIFDADDYQDSSQTVTIEDAIAPVLADHSAFTKDSDGDGVVDGVFFVFSETLSSDLDGADAGDIGATLTRIDDQDINPFGLVDPVTGELGSVTIPDADDDEDNEIVVTGVTLMSYDADDDGEISELETNNALCFSFDPTQDFAETGGGWDDDVDTTAGTGDAPGTGDTGTVDVELAADASTPVSDANTVAIDGNISGSNGNDAAPAVAVNSNYLTGDNMSGFAQLFSEQDGNVGDDANNNRFFAIFSEDLGFFVRGFPGDASDISWGAGADDRFRSADQIMIGGTDDNIVMVIDGGSRGLAPDDTVTFSSGNGVLDGGGNEVTGSFAAPDGSAPFVALQTDINGNTVISAFLFDTTDPADGFADEVRLFTNRPIDPATVQVGDFSFDGGEFDSATVSAAGDQITLVIPSGEQVPITAEFEVSYDAPSDNDDADSQIIAGPGGNSVTPGTESFFTAEQFPTPDVDTDDLAVMDIRGTVSMGEAPIGVGAKVFGFVSVPKPKMVSFTASNITYWVSDDYSMEAVWDFVYGFEDHLYAHVSTLTSEAYLSNSVDTSFLADLRGGPIVSLNDATDVYDLTVNAGNLSNVTFTGRGRSFTTASTPERNLTLSNGRITFGWDVLRSSDGTIAGLKSNGFDCSGPAIASRAVIDSADGAYALHLSAPITQFYGSFGAAGWPVIVVVEGSNGNRYPATSIHNAVDNEGTLYFRPLQRNTDPNDDNNRTRMGSTNSGSNLVFDINLDNLGLEMLYEGWNLMPFNRVSGFAANNGGIPTLPAIQGEDNSNVVVPTGTALPFTRAFNQFLYFLDYNRDGLWTSADDGGPERGGSSTFFSSMVVDVDCLDHMRFVMTNRGVNVGSGIGGFVGGYAAGFFSGSYYPVGVFQFGAQGDATEIFDGTFTSSTTLGWALVTAPAGDASPDTWLNTNDADFVIEFNRTSNSEVDVNTFGNESDNINDVVEINAGQAYFVSFE